jgi:hypothetical protein
MVAVDKTRRFVGTGEVIAVEVWRGMWLYGVLLGQPQPPAHKAEFYSSANSPHSVGYIIALREVGVRIQAILRTKIQRNLGRAKDKPRCNIQR